MKNIKNGRVVFIIGLFLLLCLVFVGRLIQLQLVDGREYLDKSVKTVVTTVPIKATRGCILDRYCQPLVYNTLSLSVVVNRKLVTDLNGLIENLIAVFEKTGATYINTFPITYDDGVYAFNEAYLAGGNTYKKFNSFVSSLKIPYENSPEEIVNELVSYYKLTDRSAEQAFKTVCVRYEIVQRTESNLFTFAENVDMETATMIRENADKFAGVSIMTASSREYTYDYFASHVLGTVGLLSADEYAAMKSAGYTVNDHIGKSGIEKVFESYLRGTDGSVSTTTDVTNNKTVTVEQVDAKPGNDVLLTLNASMQKLLESSLAEAIADIRAQNGQTAVKSGAAVFMDVNSGEIYCMASYPTYNLATYSQDFATVSKDPSSPYINRVIAGSTPAGSTYKMVAGIAALENGVITTETTYDCHGIYTYYADYQPTCYGGKAHEVVNLKNALRVSCNGFFFDAARQTGIEILNRYSKMLGFGAKTGIELPGESVGIVAGPEAREKLGGDTWQEGETLLAAIGQSDNAVTPLQLVNYIAAIANGGKQYTPHIVKSIRNSLTGELVYEPEITCKQLEISQETLDSIMEGLVAVVAEPGGTGYSSFRNFSLTTVAMKTGTAEYSNAKPTTVMIGVAPAKDPEIAFAIVMENSGTDCVPYNANIVKTILQYYFTKSDFNEIY